MIRTIFMGTPDFSVLPLKTLLNDINNCEVIAVVTNNDKPFGRKRIMTPSPVCVEAEKHGIKVLKYDKIRIEGVEDIKALCPDLIVTCAFGQILSQEIIDIPRLGVVNIHASILPKYRGASPVHYAILNGEKETGITIMKTDIGIDTGDILYVKKTPVLEGETCGALMDRLSALGASAIFECFDDVVNGKIVPIKQDDLLSSYTPMIQKTDALINWKNSAESIYNQIRAFNPAPIAYTFYNGEMLKIYSAKIGTLSGAPGKILRNDNEIEIGTGSGSLIVCSLQKAGGKVLNVSDFLRGNTVNINDELG